MTSPKSQRFTAWWGSIMPVLVLAVGLLFPLVYVVVHGWTLTGLYEESIGYRYFYSLRRVYGQEYVFLPQGQLGGVVNQAIQLILTTFGYTPDVLFPRIDLFVFLALAVAHLLAIVVFAWAVRPLGTVIAKVGAALFWLLLYYLPAPFTPYILQPDYHTWMISVGLFTAGAFTRWSDGPPSWGLRDSVVLGVFAGLVGSIKLTLLIFPGVLALTWMIFKRPVRRSIGMAFVAVGIAQVTGLIVLLVYYHGNVAYTTRFLKDLGRFLSGVEEPKQSYLQWLWIVVIQAPWAVGITVALPVLLLIAALVFRKRPAVKSISALGVGAAVYHWLLFNRSVPATWLEATVFLQLTIWVIALSGERGIRVLRWKWGGIIIGLILASVMSIDTITTQLDGIGKNDAANRHLWQILNERPGRTMFLIPDNQFRPLSVDSAISKGGGDIFGGKYSSALVRRVAPGREYVLQPRHLEADDFSTIVFTVPHGMGLDKQKQMARLAEFYLVPFFLFDCDGEVDFVYQTVFICARRLAMAEYISLILGVRVDKAPGELNQYLIRSPQGSVDLTKIGKVHTDVGYAVGLTLPNGAQIGFRYEPLGSQEAR